ncbi:MAG: polysaccharide deacetylase family protein [Alphaproteobacteria bacterium]|nr:polysaccharide deacetylase family protein [Alphaproteobacteria bacterium]
MLPALFLGLLLASPASATGLIEYHMHMAPEGGARRVALTFDACTGKVDERILNALVENNIKATIFVTARWLKRNPAAVATLKAHASLFEIENHGAQHLPAVDEPRDVFGLRAAGSADAVRSEVSGGAAAVKAAFGTQPKWFRGAAAEYTGSSMALIKGMGFRLGGFSITGDGGATWTAAHAERAVSAAKNGNVIIAHINQPAKPAGEGVVKGILKLKADGFSFVTLNEGF